MQTSAYIYQTGVQMFASTPKWTRIVRFPEPAYLDIVRDGQTAGILSRAAPRQNRLARLKVSAGSRSTISATGHVAGSYKGVPGS
jgi:hypothetical protein